MVGGYLSLLRFFMLNIMFICRDCSVLVPDLLSMGDLFYPPLELGSGLKRREGPIWWKEGEGLTAFRVEPSKFRLVALKAAWFTP